MSDIFIGIEEFGGMVPNFRYCWVSGRYGSGKTMFSVAFSAWLVAQGYADGVCANFPNALSPSDIPVPLTRRVIIIDEASKFLTSGKNSIQYTAYLRKFQQIYILPSVFAPHPRLCNIAVERVFNGYVVGAPFWLFEWSALGGRKKFGGKFVMWRPLRMIGTYDTEFVPDTDGGILAAEHQTEALWVEQQNKRLGRKSVEKITSSEPDQMDDFTDAQITAARAVTNAAESIEDSARRIRRK